MLRLSEILYIYRLNMRPLTVTKMKKYVRNLKYGANNVSKIMNNILYIGYGDIYAA